MIKYPKKLDLAKYKKTINNPENKFGLPREVKFCKKCVVSNQRPNSTIEFANKPSEIKKTIHFDEEGICDACNFIKKKKVLIGKRENLNFKSYVTSTEKITVNTIALFLDQEGKIAFSHLIY